MSEFDSRNLRDPKNYPFPPIPTPTTDPKALLSTSRALVETVEVLTGIRGNGRNAALLRRDSASVGVSGAPPVIPLAPDAAGCGDVDISGTTLVTIASAALVLEVGDTIRFEMYGYVRNNTGASQRVNLAIGIVSGVELTVSGSADVATATDTPVFIRGYVGVVSTAQVYLSAEAGMDPVSSAGSAVSTVMRGAWQQSTSDFTGAQTVRIAGRGSTTASGLNIRVAGYMIQKMRV
jgi:hypothetical protein